MPTSHFTKILNSDQKNLSAAEKKDMESIYLNLKNIAKSQKFKIKSNGLNTTALVNEAWLKTKGTKTAFNDRNHYFAYCSVVMRHILIEQAHKNKLMTSIEDNEKLLHEEIYQQSDYLLDLERQLLKLSNFSKRLEQIFTYRFFGDMEFDAIAKLLEISERTVIREWKKARIMLSVAIEK